MIDVVHYPQAGSWTYESTTAPPLIGGGHDLEKSKSAADHAVRQYLSARCGSPVSLAYAQQRVRHSNRT